ncbi:hypothetical protein P879_11077 [Paragonimus westermani]|uniref:tRNA/rRNA methyltransferase SpoU type domain-containing protein n=1 Tax=Paragonimus westermani TaxID=34504 RepID=A0A8T0D584_9TREM|nr:hypothetical protein P879_11077 [Paragonimus westermani]
MFGLHVHFVRHSCFFYFPDITLEADHCNRMWRYTLARICHICTRDFRKAGYSGQILLYGDELQTRSRAKRIERKKSDAFETSVDQRPAVSHRQSKSVSIELCDRSYPELSADDPRLWGSGAIERARGHDNMCPTERTVVLEGKRLIMDALASGGHIHSLYFSSRECLTELNLSKHVDKVFYVPHRVLKRFSALKTFPGLLAILRVPNPSYVSRTNTTRGLWRPLPVTLILNSLRDPGNMGSLLRTAAGFGLSSVLVSKGSVDIWNEKVVRAGMSAHFRVPIYQGLSWAEIGSWLKEESIRGSGCMKVYVADVAVGETERLLSKYAVGDRVAEDKTSNIQKSTTTNAEHTVDDSDLLGNMRTAFQAFLSSPTEPSAYRLPLTTCPHFLVDYFPVRSEVMNDLQAGRDRSKLALVVGAEAEGLSPEAYYLAHLTGGARVVIPSAMDTESLNVLSATSVVIGEIQRQFLYSCDASSRKCK